MKSVLVLADNIDGKKKRKKVQASAPPDTIVTRTFTVESRRCVVDLILILFNLRYEGLVSGQLRHSEEFFHSDFDVGNGNLS